jgi:nitrite reductase/ring-hydroxylating ferredoxin subunit/uncharacterized membrane protein
MRRPKLAMAADAGIGRIEAASSLDAPGHAVETAMARPAQVVGKPAERLGKALHGNWLGHPVHPLLVTVPIGAWTLALGLDLLAALGLSRDRKGNARVADTALKAGAAGAVAAAATGLADWQHLNGRDRRVGTVHALANSAALVLNLASIVLRGRGRRGEGRAASAAGWACMFAGGYLGGHLVYRRRVGVDHADRSPEPREFRPVLPFSDLVEDRPRRVEVWDENVRQAVGVVLVRHGGRVHAMGARCSHMGGPLDQGWVLGGALVCPWHGSRYDLETGWPASGPSTCPQPRYEVRLRGGAVEIRREQEPGDEVVTAERLARREPGDAQPPAEAERDGAAAPHRGRKADEVLTEHHQLLRRLFRLIEATPRENPERRDLLRTLASELEIHEHIDDHIFYPAVRPVSEDVAIAHSEHRQLSDLLAETLKLDTAGAAFEEHLRSGAARGGGPPRGLGGAVDVRPRATARGRAPARTRARSGSDAGGAADLAFPARFRDLKIRLLEGV